MNLPNLLTWLRMLAIPLLVAVFFLPISQTAMNTTATVLFVAAAVTDWVDGWLARKLGQTSAFGAFLDPVADKLLVCAALVMLVELNRVGALVAVIIIGREITISALREWMAQIGARGSVAVHSIGKFKTIAQLVAIPMLLFHDPLMGVVDVHRIGTWLIYVAAVLTVWSMLYYLRKAWPYLSESM
ncbi:MAG TPA: CDP-diacylglycerol--glycerol-3-phosphate 3-phosphatidyltransferase [Quisquiliibacterium sp.]|nr:CDP-diacylglycerol--glycerol-3-phosphate 3-phosphatidyltransferase [Quisquiliibacterium sp.]HQP68617.1 CDP-diacylglycerol--glycerol-3-phosphate 3-phosphatidyltransferase [Quisquiliibacterium sp.]